MASRIIRKEGSSSRPYSTKRAEPRVRTQALPVKVTGECNRLYGYSRDLSCSGMQVRAFSLCPDWPKPVGERISIEFSVPEKGIDFFCKGEVVWKSVPPNGHENMVLQGIRFVDLEPEARVKIKEWMKAKGNL